MTVLAGDIGGTKTHLQLVDTSSGVLQVLYEQRYVSVEYGEFLPLAQAFLEEASKRLKVWPMSACFGVAGPVYGRHARTTNLPWTLDADALEQALSIPQVSLLNDFQVVGYGIEYLEGDDLTSLQESTAKPYGVRAVIGAGTGLGHAILVWSADHYEVLPSEAGHMDFAAKAPLEMELLGYLQSRYGHATWERVVSGPGLANITDFLLDHGKGEATNELQQARSRRDMAAVISRLGMAKSDPVAVQALELWARLYGSRCGDFALACIPRGGLYIAGGIAPKLVNKLRDGTFMQGFLDKEDRIRTLLESLPVQVIMNEQVGLIGAAMVASRLYRPAFLA